MVKEVEISSAMIGKCRGKGKVDWVIEMAKSVGI